MKKSVFKTKFLFSFLALVVCSNLVLAQTQLTTPRVSQKALVMQRIGLTDITIDYHRPAVNNREVWRKLVPYNQVWRAGANENTTITFSDPVKIEGKDLPSGTYGLHMIPGENEWTIIFSNNHWSWGSFSYDQKEDALRINVKPADGEFKEWLTYSIDNPGSNSADVNLHWENLKVGFNVSIDAHQLVLNNFMKELDNIQGFVWQGWNQAANYAFQNNVNIDEAMTWVDKSIGINRNATNLWTKANLLEKKGNKNDVENLRSEALSIATENEMNAIGYQFLFSNQTDKAIEIFQKNIELHPESWNVYDSLGEAYAAKGEKELAVENYKKAFEMVKDNNNKQRITNVLKGLETN